MLAAIIIIVFLLYELFTRRTGAGCDLFGNKFVVHPLRTRKTSVSFSKFLLFVLFIPIFLAIILIRFITRFFRPDFH
jgi:hypothetical protein